MFYTIYKITNQINGKVYIGSHKTKDLNDKYMGSGKYLKYAQEKHGIENFTKEILFVFDTPEQMYEKESEIVNDEFLTEQNTYNIKIGGFGGWDYINNNKLSGYSKKEVYSKGRINADVSLFEKYGDNWRDIISKKGTDKLKQILQDNPNYLKGRVDNSGKNNPMYGKKHSDSSKQKMSKLQSGRSNSQHGKCWVMHPEYGNKSIKKEHLDNYINLGYKPGRKIKSSI